MSCWANNSCCYAQDNCCQEGNRDKLKDFDYAIADPQDSEVNPVVLSSDVNNPTVVARVKINHIRPRDKVWLNGLFHIDNDQNDPITVDVRIYVNSIVPGQEIYKASIEIDKAFHDDLTQPIPVQHVDLFDRCVNSVTYILVVSAEESVNNQIFLNRPVTFTASLIR